jgi:hypothetical protein
MSEPDVQTNAGGDQALLLMVAKALGAMLKEKTA